MTARGNARSIIRYIAVGMLATGLTAHAQSLPSDLDETSGARLPFPTRADLGEAGRPVADIFAPGDDPEQLVRGPLAFASYNPAVGTALLDLHNGAVTQGTLDAGVRELAILVACRETNYTLEWNAHVGLAQNEGVDENVIRIVQRYGPIDELSDEYATVIRFGRELLGQRDVSPETFANAVDLFGERGTMDLVAVMMTYAVSGFYAIAVDEHPPGQELLSPQL
jgi:4-carboxymuconolactone decarboxylase